MKSVVWFAIIFSGDALYRAGGGPPFEEMKTGGKRNRPETELENEDAVKSIQFQQAFQKDDKVKLNPDIVYDDDQKQCIGKYNVKLNADTIYIVSSIEDDRINIVSKKRRFNLGDFPKVCFKKVMDNQVESEEVENAEMYSEEFEWPQLYDDSQRAASWRDHDQANSSSEHDNLGAIQSSLVSSSSEDEGEEAEDESEEGEDEGDEGEDESEEEEETSEEEGGDVQQLSDDFLPAGSVNWPAKGGGKDGEGNACPICLTNYEDLVEGDEMTTTVCGHTYCQGCLQQQIQNKGLYSACPYCREHLVAPAGIIGLMVTVDLGLDIYGQVTGIVITEPERVVKVKDSVSGKDHEVEEKHLNFIKTKGANKTTFLSGMWYKWTGEETIDGKGGKIRPGDVVEFAGKKDEFLIFGFVLVPLTLTHKFVPAGLPEGLRLHQKVFWKGGAKAIDNDGEWGTEWGILNDGTEGTILGLNLKRNALLVSFVVDVVDENWELQDDDFEVIWTIKLNETDDCIGLL